MYQSSSNNNNTTHTQSYGFLWKEYNGIRKRNFFYFLLLDAAMAANTASETTAGA